MGLLADMTDKGNLYTDSNYKESGNCMHPLMSLAEYDGRGRGSHGPSSGSGTCLWNDIPFGRSMIKPRTSEWERTTLNHAADMKWKQHIRQRCLAVRLQGLIGKIGICRTNTYVVSPEILHKKQNLPDIFIFFNTVKYKGS